MVLACGSGRVRNGACAPTFGWIGRGHIDCA